jgi:hypothetical protein
VKLSVKAESKRKEKGILKRGNFSLKCGIEQVFGIEYCCVKLSVKAESKRKKEKK